MPKLTPFTRTRGTEKSYKDKINSLIKKAHKELEIPSWQALSLKQFVGWLCAGRGYLAKNSWKLYRSAAIYYIEENFKDSKEQEEVLDLLESLKFDLQDTKPEPETSAKKMKGFPAKQFIRLVNFLNREGEFKERFIQSQFSEGLRIWLEAGILTGLRPIEWSQAEFIDEKGNERLVVKNAKATNNRANGEKRTLILKSLTDYEKEVIKQHVEITTGLAKVNRFEWYKDGCSLLLTRAYKILYPKAKKTPSLYSLRHQFSADAKASGFTREEIAALMGHAADDTAKTHYAPKRSGNKNSFCRILPDPNEVLTVRKVSQNTAKERSINLERIKAIALKKH